MKMYRELLPPFLIGDSIKKAMNQLWDFLQGA
jgi:hypothetical protein